MPQHSPWETRRRDDRVATNADQTEFAAISYGSGNMDAGTFDDRIAESLDDYEASDPLHVLAWARQDATLDSAASDIGIEIRRRQRILGAAYPFKIAGNCLQYRQSRTLVYEFCLAVSQATSLKEGDYARLPSAFERLVRDVLIGFLGPGAKGMRTGWPADSDKWRPARFKELVECLHELTGEWFWSPDYSLPDDPDPKHVKDEGLDILVWKDVPDQRPGKLFVLGQCACGNDYQTKFYDIDPNFEKLKKWVKPLSYATPLRAFATPRHIPNDVYFADVNRQAGLTFDRARIALLAERKGKGLHRRARDLYAGLIRVVINGFQVDQPAP